MELLSRRLHHLKLSRHGLSGEASMGTCCADFLSTSPKNSSCCLAGCELLSDMPQIHRGRTLEPTQAAWLAGLIDGDGTIALPRRHQNENRQLEVSISNTDFVLLEYVKSIVGMGRITRKRAISTNHTPSGAYQVSNRQALSLLNQIYPYLRTYKSKRAKLVVENYVRLTPRNGCYTSELLDERRQFVHEFIMLNPKHRHRTTINGTWSS
jgi:hypothetical protein